MIPHLGPKYLIFIRFALEPILSPSMVKCIRLILDMELKLGMGVFMVFS